MYIYIETIIKAMKKFKFHEKFSLELIFLTNSDAVTKILDLNNLDYEEEDQSD